MTGFSALEQPRVLLVSLSGIGNLLMATPILRALHDANPRVAIDVLVANRGTADVLAANPRVRAVLRGTPKPTLAEWFDTVRRIRRGRYDIGLIAHPGQRLLSASLLAAGGVGRRVGHVYRWIGREASWLLTDAVPLLRHEDRALTDRSAHDVIQNLRLLEPIGVRPGLGAERPGLPGEPPYDFPLAPEDRTAADAWLAEHKLDAAALVGMHPGAHADLAYKRWPADRWSELGDRLSEARGAAVLVFGGPDERALEAEVAARMRKSAALVDLPLRAAAALISRCAFFVSNDSGLMHVAASQGVSTFGLFGPTDERRTAPWGTQGVVIRAPGTVPTYDVASLGAVRDRRAPDPSLLALYPRMVADRITAAVRERAG